MRSLLLDTSPIVLSLDETLTQNALAAAPRDRLPKLALTPGAWIWLNRRGLQSP